MMYAVLFDHLMNGFAWKLTMDTIGIQDEFKNLGFVAAGYELHASIFSRCGFKRYPEIERLSITIAPESVVLVPRRRGTGARRFEEAAVELHNDVVTEEIACDVEQCRTSMDVMPYQRRFDTVVGEFTKACDASFR